MCKQLCLNRNNLAGGSSNTIMEDRLEGADGRTKNIAIDIKKITIHVFSYAAFRIKYDAFTKRDQSLASNHRVELAEALGLILDT